LQRGTSASTSANALIEEVASDDRDAALAPLAGFEAVAEVRSCLQPA